MSHHSRRIVPLLLLLLLAPLSLLLVRCSRPAAAPKATKVTGDARLDIPVVAPPTLQTVAPAENLGAASVHVPASVTAGAGFRATWTGPDNAGDYLTIVRPAAKPASYENYRETRHGASLELTAPIEPGDWEVRYVTARSKTVLGRVPLVVSPAAAVLVAADEVVLGAPVSITWSGPNNAGDYICIVEADAPDQSVGNYTDAAKGSPLAVPAPVVPGGAEIQYVAGQSRKVLARRKITVLAPETSVTAATTIVAGASLEVSWKGPANAGDYVTVVAKGTPDGRYGNYTPTTKGTPLKLVAPIESGEAEIRYMTGTGARVLARRNILVVPAEVSLDAVAQATSGAAVVIHWSGPKNPNDYITIVPQGTRDGQYASYADAVKGSPVSVKVPANPGPAEIRYMSGQGAKVLARRPITVVSVQSSHADSHPSGGGIF